MEPFKTTIEFTDEELKTLNDVLRSTKLTFSSEEALLIKLGRGTNPVLELTHKVAATYERRAQDAMNEAKSVTEAPKS